MTVDYPHRLVALQAQLHRVRSQHEELCATLPWSADPLEGWQAREGVYSHRGDVEASPGYTPQQRARKAAFERRLSRLTGLVLTDPFWSTLAREDIVEARMGLKRAHLVQGA
ncbi:hypothetical protein OHA84_37945 (plasmid) [Streptomyces sp. NBC_00513]|uniref:hypothetical protein n=1 Tax=unclassified Streptomyces TaxID=2593676 RepID=UPI00224FCBEC|nr:hypothetical protein [Streptomyces sp. NBC_00424]MCX5078765.1 hypothetical protein [Streptomyces sp. NBC_00424]WUD46313.1 hypothetical protein OHA84_37945 [Streptomyces sp. NBC_00513]